MNIHKVLEIDNIDINEVASIFFSMPCGIEVSYKSYRKSGTFHFDNNFEKVFEYFISLNIPFLFDVRHISSVDYKIETRNHQEIFILYDKDNNPYIKLTDKLLSEISDEYNKNLIKQFLLMESL